jgi:anthranilate synthase/aminodeoxychorismate synthase-like glutamine amidotransferase
MILIIDNYDSFTYNLVHMVAVQDKNYKVARNDEMSIEEIRALNPDKILISPGPGRPENAGITEDVIRAFGERVPILGVCLGHQAIGRVFGSKVVHAPSLMHGKTSEVHHDKKTVFKNVENAFTATRYHSLSLDPDSIPEDELEISAWTEDGVIMGVRHRKYPVEGIQFHPESILTTEGAKIIRNWLEMNGKEK